MTTATATVVATTRGKVRGTVEDGVHVFRGIPYAEPPVGPLRFRPPVPRAPWDGVRDATRFGHRHVQDFDPIEALLMNDERRPPVGEDCLNLNVWTPDPAAGGMPVLVWIHGGSLKFGTGADLIYDGATFARDDVVVVTCNYRLHPAGYLYVGDRPGSGAFGLLDQLLVLEWVRDNVAAFGGDPDRVTVAGESAGAHSVGSLLAAPRARGLFRRAILQSGAAAYELPVRISEVVGREVLRRVGVHRPDAPDDAALAALDSHALLAASREVERELGDVLAAAEERATVMGVVTGAHCMPTVGGDVLPEPALDAVAAGAARGVDLLIGTNLDETTVFTPAWADVASAVAGAAFGASTRTQADVLAAYRRGTPGGTDLDGRQRFLTDALFRICAIQLAEAAQRHARVYSYLLTWGSPPSGAGLGAFHGLDLPFMWKRLDAARHLEDLVGRPLSVGLAEAMHGAWVEFVTNGVPRHPDLPDWPAYDPRRRATLLLDTPSRVVDDPLGEERRLWDGVRF
jgi:carboxylesterase type B